MARLGWFFAQIMKMRYGMGYYPYRQAFPKKKR